MIIAGSNTIRISLAKFIILLCVSWGLSGTARAQTTQKGSLEGGILVINTNKSVYAVGETVAVDMAVLDGLGDMVCDAELDLTIKDEHDNIVHASSTRDGSIRALPGCPEKNFKLTPDFEASFQATEPCQCAAELTARTENSEKKTATSFEITRSPEFNIERRTATRIYPVHEYPVAIVITPSEDFKGLAIEKAPGEAGLKTSPKAPIDTQDAGQTITWSVDWKKGNTYFLKYAYKLPEDSPALYELGPLTIKDAASRETVFMEKRAWQIAVDPRLSFGTAVQFEANDTSRVQSAVLDADKFVMCWADGGAAGQCRVGTVAGTTITWGAEVQFVADAIVADTTIGVCPLDIDKFAVVFTNDAAADDGYTVAASVAGTTITYGTTLEFDNSDIEWQHCSDIDTDKYIIGYNDETAGDVGQGVVCTAAGLTVACGTPVDYSGATQFYSQYNAPAKLDTDKFVVAFRGADTSDGFVVAGSTAGTTITWGTTVTITTDDVSTTYTCVPQDADRFVVVYNNETGSAGEAIAGTAAGLIITLGAITDFNPASQNTGTMGCTFISATQFVVAYADVGASQFGVTVLCDVNWGTRAITCRPQQTFAGVDILTNITTDQWGIELLDGYGTVNAKIVTGYIDTPGTNDGFAIVGQLGPLLGAAMVTDDR